MLSVNVKPFLILLAGLVIITPFVSVQEAKQSDRETRKTYPDLALQGPPINTSQGSEYASPTRMFQQASSVVRKAACGPCGIRVVTAKGLLAHTRGQELFRLPTPLGLDEYFHIPEDNPLTSEKIELGRQLFFDKLLSANRSVSCASCHKAELAFSDGLTVSLGVGGRKGTRNAPALINRAYGQSFFWDGRIRTLEEQVLHPIQDPAEMNLALDELIARFKADARYAQEFRRAFADGISSANVSRALASFVRTLRSGNSDFDKFQHGDQAALSVAARRGLELFRGKANCVACHVGPNFTDEQFHNTGVSWGRGDLGRYGVSGKEKDRGAFKTPTPRDVARTAPYMHDGSIATLEEVIEYYNRGANANPHLDSELRPLLLTPEEKTCLLAFLKALNGSIAQSETDALRKSMH